MSECTHTPKCITRCRVCGKPLPEFSKEQEGEKFTALVTYENGSQHTIVECVSLAEAEERSNTMLARSAGLCQTHLVRVTLVEKIGTADALHRMVRGEK